MARKIKGEVCDLCDEPAVTYENGEFLCYRHSREKKTSETDLSDAF